MSAASSARQRCIDRWQTFTRDRLEAAAEGAPFPEPFERWYSCYSGSGPAAPNRAAMAEPFIGSWENPRLVTLGLNPGAADLGFQGRRGFARRAAADGYAAWAATGPYGSAEWEAHNVVNRPRRDGRRVNGHRQARLVLRAAMA